MECLIGIKFNNYLLIAADTSKANSIVVMKRDDDKFYKLCDKMAMLVCGDGGDNVQFAEYIAKNVQLYKMRNGYELSPHAASTFTRRVMADALRSRNPYNVNVIMAGYDDSTGPELYFLDYLASMVKMPFAIHGYGSFFNLSVLDRYYKENLTPEEGMEVLQKCVDELQTRFLVNLPSFHVRQIDTLGIHDKGLIKAKVAA